MASALRCSHLAALGALAAACGGVPTAAPSTADSTAATSSIASPSGAEVEPATLRAETPTRARDADLWRDCTTLDGRIACPDGFIDVAMVKGSFEATRKKLADGAAFSALAIDGVPEGLAFAGDHPSAHDHIIVLADRGGEEETAQLDCWPRPGFERSQVFCERVAARFSAGTPPPPLPAHPEGVVWLLGTRTELFDGASARSRYTATWSGGRLMSYPYDDEENAVRVRDSMIEGLAKYSSLELFDFRCKVAGVEGDCVLAQAQNGLGGKVYRSIAGALRSPAGWHAFLCHNESRRHELEDDYGASCGQYVEILPAQ